MKDRRTVRAATDQSEHGLRHVAATNTIAAGTDVKLAHLMLGHTDATDTLRTYSNA
ncbi:tyrosine-type recombinase/integrase [Microbacterium maritypicum]|uniref:tyrosine-type recombinase/integrase n=1 Tax=Microbacterium TaxID=33882 RepID=UPI00359FBD53